MIETFTGLLDVYGLPIAFLGIVIYFFLNSVKTHKKERDEWRGDMKQTTDRYDDRQKETTEVLRQLTSVIQQVNNKK